MNVNKLFDYLDDWRRLPSYQLERRADILFAIYLKDILYKLKDVSVVLIIPEFPLRLGELPEHDSKINSSFKIDYLAYSKNRDEAYLIELKTDLRSRRQKQDNYYREAEIIGLPSIIGGVIKIYNATRQKVKYNHLIDKLVGLKWIVKESNTVKNNAKNIKLTTIFIQPKNPNNQDNIISFDDIINSLSDKTDKFTRRFIKSLEKWKTDPNH